MHLDYALFSGEALRWPLRYARFPKEIFIRQTVLSILAGLALCSTATAAVITTNARAEQPARKPVMIAQAGSQRDADMDRERQPRCRDIVADKADDMA